MIYLVPFATNTPPQMRAILHSWTDEQCIGILNNIRSAMKPTSRIFVRTSPARPSLAIESLKLTCAV